MNKTELIDAIAERADVDKKVAERVLQAALDAISGAVAAGDKVVIAGFGTFERRDRSAREGRNPQTGEAMQIAATRVPAFKAGASFKSQVAG